jgi:hypothetical protein
MPPHHPNVYSVKPIKPIIMKKYIKIDKELGISSICDTKEDVMIGCGYDSDEITFEKMLLEIDDVYTIIEIEGDVKIKWLTD